MQLLPACWLQILVQKWRAPPDIVLLPVSGHAASPGMLAFILRKLRACIPLMVGAERLQRLYMRQAITIFGTHEGAARVQAFLFVRQMAGSLPGPVKDYAMKVTTVSPS
jgi:hypothetical protein